MRPRRSLFPLDCRPPCAARRGVFAVLCAVMLAYAAPGNATTVKSEWVIRDAQLRLRVFHSLEEFYRFAQPDSAAMLALKARNAGAEVLVEAIDNREENTRRLVGVEIDSIRIAGTENIRAAFGETLYDFVTARKGYEYDVTRTTPDEQSCGVLWWPNERIRVGLDQQMVQVSSNLAIIDQIGNPNVLMPWWQYGMFRIGVAHPNFRFMFQGPFAAGTDRLWFIEKRRIDGAYGGAFEFHVENWSGEIAYASMSKKTSLYDAFVAPPAATYISTIVQVKYSVTASAGAWGSFLISFGGGIHIVQHDSIGAAPQNLLYDAAQDSPLIVSPTFDIAFVSTHDDVELSAHYDHSTAMFTAAARIAGPVWISATGVMIKALHSPDPWEPDNALFVTPQIRL